MGLEDKVLSRELQDVLYESGQTLGTAESCTGGRIAEAIISTPGASEYFKGGIVCYTNEIKERLLGVSHDLLEEKTAVCEEVAVAMVKGAVKALNTTYAVAVTGVAGPGGGTKENPVGTIWISCGTAQETVTLMLSGDEGRDVNLSNATCKALQLLLDFVAARVPHQEREG